MFDLCIECAFRNRTLLSQCVHLGFVNEQMQIRLVTHRYNYFKA